MKWNESESEVVYSDPAIQRSTCLSPMVVYSDPVIDMSQSTRGIATRTKYSFSHTKGFKATEEFLDLA